MKQYSIRYSESFYEDLQNIVAHIIERTRNAQIAKRFYEQTFNAINRRSYSADSFEKFYPFEGSEAYYRIYIGNYVIFYIITGDEMDVRRMLWSGVDKPKHLRGSLHKYANPDLIPLEKHAHTIHVLKKYGKKK